MEQIFKNTTKLTEKEYKIFLKSYQNEHAKADLLYSLFYSIFFIICAIMLLINKDYLVGGILLLGVIAYMIYKYFRTKKIAQNNNKKLNIQITNKYDFYNNYFDIENQEGSGRIWYVKMYKVVETNTHFYIYISREYAYIISKSGFTKGEEKDFSKFIKKKAMYYKYRNRKEK